MATARRRRRRLQRRARQSKLSIYMTSFETRARRRPKPCQLQLMRPEHRKMRSRARKRATDCEDLHHLARASPSRTPIASYSRVPRASRINEYARARDLHDLISRVHALLQNLAAAGRYALRTIETWRRCTLQHAHALAVSERLNCRRVFFRLPRSLAPNEWRTHGGGGDVLTANWPSMISSAKAQS